jgi:hypothetical protein
MNNLKYAHLISSTLKTVASENIITEDELKNTNDQPLEAILNSTNQTNEKETLQIPEESDQK